LNDALNTACIFAHLDIEAALKEYGEIRERFTKKAEEKELPRGFAQIYEKKGDVIHDTEMTDFTCPVCGGRAACFGFASQNPYKYIALGKCENGDELFVGFKFKKLEGGRYRAARVVHPMTDEHRELYATRTKNNTFGRSEEEAMDSISALKV
jgi:hypothetical protein